MLEAKWNPGLTYVVRIREAGAAAWSLWFESPLTHFSFFDLKPGTEYEVQVRAGGRGRLSRAAIRLKAQGDADVERGGATGIHVQQLVVGAQDQRRQRPLKPHDGRWTAIRGATAQIDRVLNASHP